MQDLKTLKFQIEIAGKRFVFRAISIAAAINADFIFGNIGLWGTAEGK